MIVYALERDWFRFFISMVESCFFCLDVLINTRDGVLQPKRYDCFFKVATTSRCRCMFQGECLAPASGRHR